MSELERIQALTLNDLSSFIQVLNRIIDFSIVIENDISIDDPVYKLDDQLGADLYDQLVLHSSLVKPELSVFESEFLVYKQELIDAENARLVEVARVNDIMSRWQAIEGRDAGIPAFHSIISNQSNPHLYFKEQILDEVNHGLAEQRLSALEVQEQLEISKSQLSVQNEVLKIRQQYLDSTDFTQLADAPFTSEEKAEYREYRQYLRDYPALISGGQMLQHDVMLFDEWKVWKASQV